MIKKLKIKIVQETLLLVSIALFSTAVTRAETRDYAIEVSANIGINPPEVTLNWRASSDGALFRVSRKSKEATAWASLGSVASSGRSFTDRNVTAGEAYEYRITKEPLPKFGGSGFIMVGVNAPLIENRGKLLLVVDQTFSGSLAPQLARLEEDLAGDGWVVVRRDVSRTVTPPAVKAVIQREYHAAPAQLKAVFLFGHVPVPYSGNFNPDAHAEHQGAWPADLYYGDMDGQWTDSSVSNTSAARKENRNTPGDGKFDQSHIPSDVELQVGRVDLANLPGFAPKTEKDLLLQYLNKDHLFRHGRMNVQRRGLISDNFGENGGEAFASSGWRNFAPFFGSENVKDVVGWNYFSTLAQESYLWSYACGGGAYNYCHYVGGTGDFGIHDPKTVFTMLLGSYFGDWDAENSFLRGPLGAPTAGLTAVWAGRPHWFLHHMAVGETIGYSTRLSQNAGAGGLYHPQVNFNRQVHIALMGDPTLRMHPVIPPSNLSARTENGVTALSWTASNDSDLQGYHVYRAPTRSGPFTRVTSSPTAGTSFSDPAGGSWEYMVRAIKLERSPSGTYLNPSQGVFARASTGGSATQGIRMTAQRTEAHGVAFEFPAETGVTYLIEKSTDLVRWTPHLTVPSAASVVRFYGSDESKSFYRATRTGLTLP